MSDNVYDCCVCVARDDYPEPIDILNAGINLGIFGKDETELTFLGLQTDEL